MNIHYLKDKNGKAFTLYYSDKNYYYPNFHRAKLNKANLRGADLQNSNFSEANLDSAQLNDCNLTGCSFNDASLIYACLRSSNLAGSELVNTKLSHSDLQNVNLFSAYIKGADLTHATLPAPTMILLVQWGVLSDKLTKLAMMYDAVNCPDGIKLFNKWKKTGICPFKDAVYQRACNFIQVRSLWSPRTRKVTALELVKLIFKEKNIKI